MFIVFEGLDGSGSSTQAQLLSERLEKNGHPNLLTKEPTTDSPLGREIRAVLQHKWEASPEGLQLLFCADRAEHLKNDIEPALLSGRIVISDRYLLSTIAYGSLAVDDMEWLKALNKHFRVPDITFLFRLDPGVCMERIAGRGNAVELFEQKDKLSKIWGSYEAVSKNVPNLHVIDANRPIETIADDIWNFVETKLAA